MSYLQQNLAVNLGPRVVIDDAQTHLSQLIELGYDPTLVDRKQSLHPIASVIKDVTVYSK